MASYRLPPLSFHDNWASHSRDTLWPWKFKAKGTPVSAASSPPISLVFHTRTSNRLLSLSLHDNRASHSRDTTWPWKVKVKCQVQMYPSQHSVQLTHFLSVLHQGIPSTSVPFVPWLSGLHFPRYNLTLKWKSKVKVKGTLVYVVSIWLISFLFLINWTNHS